VVEGERIKKDPETCRKLYQKLPEFKAPAKYVVFKRWDKFDEDDNPDVIIFYATADVLCGLYNLINYDATDYIEMIAPWGSGCSSIVTDAYLQKDEERPKAVLGMLDVEARAYVGKDELTFALPTKRLLELVEYMDDSFLITKPWERIKKRI